MTTLIESEELSVRVNKIAHKFKRAFAEVNKHILESFILYFGPVVGGYILRKDRAVSFSFSIIIISRCWWGYLYVSVAHQVCLQKCKLIAFWH